MKLVDLKKKSIKDLHKILAESREKLRGLKFSASNKQLKNIREIRVMKKNVAQVLTLLNNPEETKESSVPAIESSDDKDIKKTSK
jgi:ribosomal protein L29